MKEIEAYRLLDLDRGALRAVSHDVPDLDIAAAPEIVQILFLGRQKRLEALVHEAIQSPTSAIIQFLSRGCMGRVIGHVFGELNWATGPGFDREGNLAKVLGVGGFVGVRARRFQCVVNRASQEQAALFRRMRQRNTTVIGVTGAMMEHRTDEGLRLPRVFRVRVCTGCIHSHLGRNDEGRRRIQQRNAGKKWRLHVCR